MARDNAIRFPVEICEDAPAIEHPIGPVLGLSDIHGLKPREGDPELFHRVGGAGGPWKRIGAAQSTKAEGDTIGTPGA